MHRPIKKLPLDWFTLLVASLVSWMTMDSSLAQTPSFQTAFANGTATDSQSGIDIRQQMVDGAGNIYVASSFFGTVRIASQRFTSVGTSDILLTKLSATGGLLWAKQLGATGYNRANGLALDDAGNLYATGYFTGTMPVGVATLTSSGGKDLFILKLTSTGDIVWTTSGGGPGDDVANSIALDKVGNAYVAGSFAGRTTTFGAFTLTNRNAGAEDVVALKLTATGGVEWAVSGGGYQADQALSLAVDTAGNSYLTGSFESTSAQFGPYTLTQFGGSGDIFVLKLNSAGVVQWATQAGGQTDDRGTGIAVDTQGRPYVVGSFQSSQAIFGSIILPHPNQGTYDVFVGRLTPSGSWDWVMEGGGPGNDFGYGLALDAANNIYTTGSFTYYATFGLEALNTAGNQNIFLWKLTPQGQHQWAVQAGGGADDYGTSVSVTPAGSVTLAGTFQSAPANFGSSLALGNSGAWSGFIAQLPAAILATSPVRSRPMLTLWPNPVLHGGAVSAAGLPASSTIEVLDMLGRVVLTGVTSATGQLELALPATVATGTYLVRVEQQVCRFTVD